MVQVLEEEFLRRFPRESKVGCKNKTWKTAQDQEVARLTFINSIYKVFIIFILDGWGPGRGGGVWVGVEEGPRALALGEGGRETSLSVFLVFVSAFSAVI